jgi:hypothetical protein
MRDESSDPSGIDATEGLVALLTGSPYRGRERAASSGAAVTIEKLDRRQDALSSPVYGGPHGIRRTDVSLSPISLTLTTGRDQGS